MDTSICVKILELLLAPVLLPSGSHLSMSSQDWKGGGQMGTGGCSMPWAAAPNLLLSAFPGNMLNGQLFCELVGEKCFGMGKTDV